MAIAKAALLELAAKLPHLTFVPEADYTFVTTSSAEDYLNAYGLNFTHSFPGLVHGFGRIDAAGFQIATHYWLPPKAKGTLLVVHGYYDHVGVFNKIIRFALEQELAVLSFDLPGHGLSSGEPAVIDSFDQYGDVLAAVLARAKTLMPLPLHCLGQSTGCAVILNYAWRSSAQSAFADFEKMVLCAPLIVPRGWLGWYMGRYLYEVLRFVIHRLKRGASHSSHDPVFNEFISQGDPLQAKYVSLRWIGAMKAWHAAFQQFMPQDKLVLVLQGTGDMTVDWRYNIPLMLQKLPTTQVVMIEGARHQLVNESEAYRNQVFAAVKQYFAQ